MSESSSVKLGHLHSNSKILNFLSAILVRSNNPTYGNDKYNDMMLMANITNVFTKPSNYGKGLILAVGHHVSYSLQRIPFLYNRHKEFPLLVKLFDLIEGLRGLGGGNSTFL